MRGSAWGRTRPPSARRVWGRRWSIVSAVASAPSSLPSRYRPACCAGSTSSGLPNATSSAPSCAGIATTDLARALLITNPVAARTEELTWHRVAQFLERAGWQTEIAVTLAPGHARELAAQAVTAGVDAVAVFGGDGTSMQAAAGLVGTEVPLGLIPGGTGNVLAGNLRIPADPLRAVRLLIHGRPRIIDLGRVVFPDGEHYFGV